MTFHDSPTNIPDPEVVPKANREVILMRTNNLLREYVSRLIHQTLVQVTGGLGFILTAMSEILFPGVFIKWVFYAIILVAGLVVSSYFVFSDLAKEYEKKKNEHKRIVSELEFRVHELENRQPRLLVGFQDESHHLVKRLQLQLSSLPPRPDFEGLVEKERRELLAKRQLHRSSRGLAAAIEWSALSKPNPHYEEDVEEYLAKYRDFLVQKYNRATDRERLLTPIIENQGNCPASDVTLEFVMPAEYERLPRRTRYIPPEELEELGITEEELDRFLLPPKPDLLVSALDWLSGLMAVPPSPVSPLLQAPQPSNTDGPIYEERDGIEYVVYTVKKLVQHRPEDDFRPFSFWLPEIDQSTVLEIPVRIYAANLPKPLEETLLIDVEVTARNSEAVISK